MRTLDDDALVVETSLARTRKTARKPSKLLALLLLVLVLVLALLALAVALARTGRKSRRRAKRNRNRRGGGRVGRGVRREDVGEDGELGGLVARRAEEDEEAVRRDVSAQEEHARQRANALGVARRQVLWELEVDGVGRRRVERDVVREGPVCLSSPSSAHRLKVVKEKPHALRLSDWLPASVYPRTRLAVWLTFCTGMPSGSFWSLVALT